MQYKYEKTDRDYSDLASGRVFYSLPGHPAFPVRLASEIFQRCMASREALYGISSPCTLYDPCCGAAYHPSVLAYLHRKHIREIVASDIDEKAVELARRNLGLLNRAGLDQRIAELTRMYEDYTKDSHQAALQSAHVLKNGISALEQAYPLAIKVFQASATDGKAMHANLQARFVDIVFTDIPYGQHSQWESTDELSNPLSTMLDTLSGILSTSSIVAVASDKGQKVSHARYQRIEQFQVGKRRVVIMRPIG